MTAARSFIDGLSEEQRRAALETGNPVLALAGAGSGKTRMLAGRFVHLVTPVSMGGLGADPGSIMMVTFTNKAAREMRERIDPLLEGIREAGGEIGRGEPWIGTFHGLSLRILRIEAARAGLGRNFSIYDEADARGLANDVSEEMGLTSFDVDDFFSDLEKVKARLISPSLLLTQRKRLEEDPEMSPADRNRWASVLSAFRCPDFVDVYARYQAALSEQNSVDFNDLINHTTQMLRAHPEVRDAWRSSFRHFMVDEVQDINRAQLAWLLEVTDGGREMRVAQGARTSDHADATTGIHEVNTFRLRQFPRPTIAFVGDDNQSIYGFRGSDVGVMRSLEMRFSGLVYRQLGTSWRCQPSILSVSNVLMGHASERLGGDLTPRPGAERTGPVRLLWRPSPEVEIAHIRSEAADYIGAGGAPSEFAVLLRTRELARHVARSLRGAGLPVVEGKGADLRKAAEVKDALSFVTFLVNPDSEVAFRRIANRPSRGLGPTSLGKLSRNARMKEISFLDEVRSIQNDRVEVPDGGEAYGTAFIRSMRDFGRVMHDLRGRTTSCSDAREALLLTLRNTGYLGALYNEAMRSAGMEMPAAEALRLEPADFLRRLVSSETGKAEDPGLAGEDLADEAGRLSAAARRIANIALLLDEAAVYPSLPAFMQEATLEMGQGTTASGIQVMTIHASKGLEFDHVRLPFWVEGVMPHGRSDAPEEIEEERRLAYVALTRARQTVEVSVPSSIAACAFIRQSRCRKSRFLDEMKGVSRGELEFVGAGKSPSFLWRHAPIRKSASSPDAPPPERHAPDPGAGSTHLPPSAAPELADFDIPF